MSNQRQQPNKGHGFIADFIAEEDYILGGRKIPEEVLVIDGQWDEFLPEIELQKRNGLESMNCVCYGTLNAIETLFKRLYGRTINKSERYIGVMAETGPGGNTPQRVIETIRKKSGLIGEELLPFDESIDSWEKYYSPLPMTSGYIREGKKWLKRYSVKHEWVFSGGKDNQEKLKEALRYSPLGVSVYAWDWEDDGLYIKKSEQRDNHWVMLYGYLEGQYWKIFDHYDDTFKKLVWDYNFNFAKRYYLSEQLVESFWQKIWRIIKSYLDEF